MSNLTIKLNFFLNIFNTNVKFCANIILFTIFYYTTRVMLELAFILKSTKAYYHLTKVCLNLIIRFHLHLYIEQLGR